MRSGRRMNIGLVAVIAFSMMAVAPLLSMSSEDEPLKADTEWFFGLTPAANTKVWNATAPGVASTGVWETTGAPTAGYDIILNATCTLSCEWDIEAAMGNITVDDLFWGYLNTTVDFSMDNFTLGGGNFSSGPSNVTVWGSWDTVNGTYLGNTSTVHLNGTDQYAMIKVGEPFNALSVNGTGIRLGVAYTDLMRLADTFAITSGYSAELLNHTYLTTSMANAGTLTQNSKRLNISGSSEAPMTGYGTFDGDIYLNGSASAPVVQTGLPMGTIHSNKATQIYVSAGQYLTVIPSISEYVQTTISSYGTETGYAARWTTIATDQVTFQLKLAAETTYDVFADATKIGTYTTTPSGVLTFSYDSWSTNEFIIQTVSGSSSPTPPSGGGVVAGLIPSFTYAETGLHVAFTDTSLGSPVQWVWNFGDMSGSEEQNPSHSYSVAGVYVVTLTVYDASGAYATVTRQVSVTGVPADEDGILDLQMNPANGAILIVGLVFLVSLVIPKMPVLNKISRKARGTIGVVLVIVSVYLMSGG